MEQVNIIQLLFYLLPAVIVALVAYYFFNSYFKEEQKRRMYQLRAENSKQALPLRFQAIERMTLFLERIDPGSLIIRVKPYNENQVDYENLLVKNIEQEFEHNLAQQVYISIECWNAIKATKNATIALIRQANKKEEVQSPEKLREVILSQMVEKTSPSQTGIAYLKKEARDIW
ncbi:hypothetical protein ACFQ3R_10275 [Mesonia ostreae]|uniref:Uncharacterized protein n=1 Tax=Mesonia ostreae TaxID=861110 RepID=A0ABU2KGD6_9FLAO|nr:hypothetical protein [Mesonia ostreae]MDT0293764.1 hypothetical protein [Mesonia ostreae]